jgi:hypothetical protein
MSEVDDNARTQLDEELDDVRTNTDLTRFLARCMMELHQGHISADQAFAYASWARDQIIEIRARRKAARSVSLGR